MTEAHCFISRTGENTQLRESILAAIGDLAYERGDNLYSCITINGADIC